LKNRGAGGEYELELSLLSPPRLTEHPLPTYRW
jgi:hypothetical protein